MGSTVWVDLATPSSPAGAVVFIDPTELTPNVDVNYFYYDNTNKRLHIATGGDFGGTDSINAYKQLDSYLPVTQQVLASNTCAGHSVSASRGTGPVPTALITGDFIGKFSGFGYTGAAGTYPELAGLWIYSVGATAANLGGEMHFVTKADNGVAVDYLTLDNAGKLFPTVNGLSRLGKAAFGFGALNLDYTITATVGAVVMNKPAGRAIIAAGAASVVVTNSLVTANSIVLAQLAAIDGTLTSIKAVVAGAGTFTITGNANAAGNTAVNFLVINTDS